MQIRTAIGTDLEQLQSLFCEQNAHNHNIAPDRVALTSDLLTVAELDEIIKDQDTSLLVAEVDGNILGLILGDCQRQMANRWRPERCFVYLQELYVKPQARQQGIARRLFDQFEDWAMELGATCIDLHVWHHNTAATECYQKLGFYQEQRLLTKNLE
ncbi:GNAT family N-acetyltransferase [Vibrio sp. SCSIO 43136]|uniref:GNAT family N-acetyltransferase n=1 Tax=Vibrio sp. SCSIO 43136 TaxID=2819101 RepID=UPI0020751116|nr:GNAT family N-acetyltransferase [Vibrio sp. SCSIO 43136]USD67053.1 GNAT family N-acetyltransferase [Vibrio sp. SCSIO 43136]